MKMFYDSIEQQADAVGLASHALLVLTIKGLCRIGMVEEIILWSVFKRRMS